MYRPMDSFDDEMDINFKDFESVDALGGFRVYEAGGVNVLD